ncbi:MAG: hypothetical protein D6778_01900 [Nitrospirae bacterium]|nr:MAG: hypothetical protein D6778_01900 [Nitrospirota bacterium]
MPILVAILVGIIYNNRRFDDVNRRFDDTNRRIDDLKQDLIVLRTEVKGDYESLRREVKEDYRRLEGRVERVESLLMELLKEMRKEKTPA